MAFFFSLLTSNNGTTDLLGGNLGHVQNDNGGDETDTKTSNETTSSHDTKTSGSSLEDTTNYEDGTTENDSNTTSDEVGNVTSGNSTEESTISSVSFTSIDHYKQMILGGVDHVPSGQDRSDERLLPWSDNKGRFAVVCNLRVQRSEAGEGNIGVLCSSVLLDEVVHVQDTSHPTSVISEEDTSKGCKSNNEVGANSDGSLDTANISRAGDGDDSTSRHDCESCCCAWRK